MLKQKIYSRLAVLLLSLMAVVAIFSFANVPMITTVYAESGLEDNVGQSNSTTGNGSDDILNSIRDEELDPDDQGVSDWLRNQRGMTSEQLESASQTMSPITTIIGYIAGGIIILVIAGVGAITALDLLYIAVPPVRNILYKAGTDGTGGYTGGFGAGGYGRGGMMGGMAMGAGGAAGGTKKPTQWVSDEAVACAAMLGGSAQSVNGMQGMGMGGYGMGAMGAQQQQQRTTKSVIGMYLKKRIFFIILLAICIIVLTSSALMDCGVNLAEWILKIINMLNGKMEA